MSILDIADAVGVDRENGLTFREARWIVDLADSLLSSALSQVQPRRARVRHDVAADRLLGIGREHGRAVNLSDNLKTNWLNHFISSLKCQDLPDL